VLLLLHGGFTVSIQGHFHVFSLLAYMHSSLVLHARSVIRVQSGVATHTNQARLDVVRAVRRFESGAEAREV